MKQRNAFTMTEMLVLVPVLALVGALLLASLGDVQEKLKAAACLNNMRQWGLGLALYANDYNDYFPTEGNTNPVDQGSNLNAWFSVVPPFIHQSRLMDLYNAGKPPTPRTKSVWICPSATNTTVSPTAATPYFTYAFNGRMDPNGPAQFKRSQLTSPTNTIVFAEEAEDNFSETTGNFCPARHFGGGNFAMGDGHAEWIAFQDFCRSGNPGCTNMTVEANSSSINGDWRPTNKYHWYPYPNTPT
jgi:prepilin-type processing-associated H-X9-DG protein